MSQSIRVNIAGMKVTIGMPVSTGRGIPAQTAMSLVKTVNHCATRGVYVDLAMEVTGIVQMGRDGVLDDFLATDSQKLFWIDSDMVWEPADFVRLLALSTRVDVVGAAYPAKVEGATTFYVSYDANPSIAEYGLMRATGLGLGFTIVDRKVIEALAAKAPRVRNQLIGREMAAVFRVDTIDGERRTEDIAFFHDIRDLGIPVWVDPSIELGHIGERQWRGRLGDALKQANAA